MTIATATEIAALEDSVRENIYDLDRELGTDLDYREAAAVREARNQVWGLAEERGFDADDAAARAFA